MDEGEGGELSTHVARATGRFLDLAAVDLDLEGVGADSTAKKGDFHVGDDGGGANDEAFDADEFIGVAGIEVAHVERGQAKGPDFVTLAHDVGDLGVAVGALHALACLLLIEVGDFEHEILEDLVHGWYDLLRVFGELGMKFFHGGVGEQVSAVEIEIGLACLAHAAQQALVVDVVVVGGWLWGGEGEGAIVSEAVFWFEALEKVAEGLHGVGEVDGGAPDGSDFVWLVGGGEGAGGERWRGGVGDVEGIGDGGRALLAGGGSEGGVDVAALARVCGGDIDFQRRGGVGERRRAGWKTLSGTTCGERKTCP